MITEALKVKTALKFVYRNSVKLLTEAGSQIVAGSLIQAGGPSWMF